MGSLNYFNDSASRYFIRYWPDIIDANACLIFYSRLMMVYGTPKYKATAIKKHKPNIKKQP